MISFRIFQNGPAGPFLNPTDLDTLLTQVCSMKHRFVMRWDLFSLFSSSINWVKIVVQLQHRKIVSIQFQLWKSLLNKLVCFSFESMRREMEQCSSLLDDNLQCAICMDDFKENDSARRLPCSHHFHDECISRWLRLVKEEFSWRWNICLCVLQHGTCPTCRVTLDGDHSSRHEYFPFSINSDSTRNPTGRNNPRSDDGNDPGSSHSQLMDFD